MSALTPGRQGERFNSVGDAKIISGVSNSYRFLYGQIDELELNQSDMRQPFSYPDPKSSSWPIIINSYKKSLVASDIMDSCERRLMEWKVLDKSLTGVGLLSQESYPIIGLGVGNFIQLNILSDDKWFSGLVRWIMIFCN